MTTFSALILTLNNSIFNSTNYLQTKVCALETTVAPPYTNISMDHIERKLIYPFIKMFSLICLRLIEETVFTWTSNKKDLMKFFNEFNTKHESIKFEYQISKTNIGFLDIKYT